MEPSDEEARRQELVRRYRSISDLVRLDIFEALRVEDQALTTAEIARRVPEARRGIQSHLRQLEEGGWIQHVDGQGRDARWIHCPPRVEYAQDLSGSAEVDLAIQELYWVASQRRVARLRHFDNEMLDGVWPPEWVAASIGRDWSVRATAHDLDELDGELMTVVNNFRDRVSAREPTPAADSCPVFVVISAFPLRARK